MPIVPRPRLPRRARAAGTVSAAPERTQPHIERLHDGDLQWIHVPEPTALERAWLAEHFDFHALDIEDVMSRNQRPKLDEYDDYLFLVLHFPVFDEQLKRLNAGELDVFVGSDFVITIPNQPLKPVQYLFERCRTNDDLRHQYFSKGSGYLLYQIVDQSFDYCFPMLRKIGNKLEQLEEVIFSGRSEEIVREISNVKQEIINFRKTIRPERTVLRDLERTKQRYLAEEMEVYFDDIVDASERIWDMLENYKEVVVALEETNESVLTHRVNDILRVLTAISVIVLPLTMIASIFGMNVGLPGGGNPSSASLLPFAIIIGVMVTILVGMVAYFKNQRWL